MSKPKDTRFIICLCGMELELRVDPVTVRPRIDIEDHHQRLAEVAVRPEGGRHSNTDAIGMGGHGMTSTEAWAVLIMTGIITVMWVRRQDVSRWKALVIATVGFTLAHASLDHTGTWLFQFAFAIWGSE
jgi:hypothetical protein